MYVTCSIFWLVIKLKITPNGALAHTLKAWQHLKWKTSGHVFRMDFDLQCILIYEFYILFRVNFLYSYAIIFPALWLYFRGFLAYLNKSLKSGSYQIQFENANVMFLDFSVFYSTSHCLIQLFKESEEQCSNHSSHREEGQCDCGQQR